MSPIRLSITPEDRKRSKIVKPGWYPTLVKEVALEPNAKRDGENVVVDFENADNKSEFFQVPAKVWFTEKFPSAYVNFEKAFNPTVDENAVTDFDFETTRGRYIYGKWTTNRGKDGTDPPRNHVEDFAPLPKQWAHLNSVGTAVPGVAGFDTAPVPTNEAEPVASGKSRK
jgi:hypothetical protein